MVAYFIHHRQGITIFHLDGAEIASKWHSAERVRDHDSEMDRLDQLLTPTELAAYLGVPIATLYVWRHRRPGPPNFEARRHLRYRLRYTERHAVGVMFPAPRDGARVVTAQRAEDLNRWHDNPCSEEVGS